MSHLKSLAAILINFSLFLLYPSGFLPVLYDSIAVSLRNAI